MTRPDPSAQTLDQRRTDRRAIEAPIRMRIATGAIEGVTDNISPAGVMFFTDEPLKVVVEVTENGETRAYAGRLVRAQRMSETNTGIAVEFEE